MQTEVLLLKLGFDQPWHNISVSAKGGQGGNGNSLGVGKYYVGQGVGILPVQKLQEDRLGPDKVVVLQLVVGILQVLDDDFLFLGSETLQLQPVGHGGQDSDYKTDVKVEMIATHQVHDHFLEFQARPHHEFLIGVLCYPQQHKDVALPHALKTSLYFLNQLASEREGHPFAYVDSRNGPQDVDG